MRLDRLTIKAQEALQEAQSLASNQTVTVDQNGTDGLAFRGT